MKFLVEYNAKAKASRVYRGSQHGFAAASFHSQCDNKGATITIIKTNSNRIFGGFTKENWIHSAGWKNDPSAFLFSVDLGQKYPITTVTHAICCSSGYGPTFGGGHDICVHDNSNSNNSSYVNFHSYASHPKHANGQSALTDGEKNFQVSEIEVYLVVV